MRRNNKVGALRGTHASFVTLHFVTGHSISRTECMNLKCTLKLEINVHIIYFLLHQMDVT